MRVCGIVCEYNPFHNGHQYHIEQTRKFADAVVCVMSGNFVQRGEPSIIRKHVRAESAVRCGADLVVELPTPWAIASAERFADGAIEILTGMPFVSLLSFGCENADISRLNDIVKILNSEEFSQHLKAELKLGLSFATARWNAIAKLSPESSVLLREPNNILAVEYLKALQSRKSQIEAVAVERIGAAHDAETEMAGFTSASFLRKIWKSGGFEEILLHLPDAKSYISEIKSGSAPAGIEQLDRAMLAVLRRMDAEAFLAFSDVSEGLHFRMKRALDQASSVSEAIDRTKSKRYAHARIRRIFLNAFLGITSDFAEQTPPYIRVLALNDTGRELLASDNFRLPVITKPAAAGDLTGFARDVFLMEAKTTDLYALAMPKPVSGLQEWSISPRYLPGKHK